LGLIVDTIREKRLLNLYAQTKLSSNVRVLGECSLGIFWGNDEEED
jgi:hypothetical protein